MSTARVAVRLFSRQPGQLPPGKRDKRASLRVTWPFPSRNVTSPLAAYRRLPLVLIVNRSPGARGRVRSI